MNKKIVKPQKGAKRSKASNKRREFKAQHRQKTGSAAPNQPQIPANDYPESKEYWTLLSDSVKLVDQVIKTVGPEMLEDMKARSIEPEVGLTHGWPGLWINYENVFIRNGRLATLAIAIHKIGPDVYMVGFLTVYRANPGEDEIEHRLHHAVRIDSLDDLVREIALGIKITSWVELSPDSQPL